MPKLQLRKLFLIRHAEKPAPDLGINGVDLNGQPDRRGLSVRGWQRGLNGWRFQQVPQRLLPGDGAAVTAVTPVASMA